MKKLLKKSAFNQLTDLYSVLNCASNDNHTAIAVGIFLKRLCSLYARNCVGVLKQLDIDKLRSDILSLIRKNYYCFCVRDQKLFTILLHYDFENDCVL